VCTIIEVIDVRLARDTSIGPGMQGQAEISDTWPQVLMEGASYWHDFVESGSPK
jgi:hypothetical protein